MEVKIALVSPKRGFFKNAGQIFGEHNLSRMTVFSAAIVSKKWKSKAVTCRMPRSLICRDMMR